MVVILVGIALFPALRAARALFLLAEDSYVETAESPFLFPGPDQALAILASGAVPAQTVVTHEFPLEEWRDGLETAMAREAGAIKVVLRP